jgi:hypothetical protein
MGVFQVDRDVFDALDELRPQERRAQTGTTEPLSNAAGCSAIDDFKAAA